MGSKPRQQSSLRELEVRPGLALRALTLADVPALFAVVDANRAYLRQWMPWLDISTTEDGIRAFVENTLNGYASGASFRWGLIIDGELSGVVSLEDIVSLHRRAKIGYWQSQACQGRGCMTDAVRAVLRYGFEERSLHLIEIRAATENRKSRAVAERVGMQLDGVLRQREWLYDHYVDLASYTLLATEWLANTSR